MTIVEHALDTGHKLGLIAVELTEEVGRWAPGSPEVLEILREIAQFRMMRALVERGNVSAGCGELWEAVGRDRITLWRLRGFLAAGLEGEP